MPVEIRNIDNGYGNIISSWGIVEEEEFFYVLKKHLTQDEDKFRKYRYSLIDHTAIEKIKISTLKVRQIADYCKHASKINPEAVVAVVADRDFVFGLVRMWQILTDETSWEIRAFRIRKDAEAWIKEKVKTKYGIADLTFD